MLGDTIDDPDGIEGPAGKDEGLALLNVDTLMTPKKRLASVTGRHLATDEAIEGYEIHIGETTGPDCDRPFLDIAGRPEGALSANGQVMAAYVHGLFAADGFRAAFLKSLGGSGRTYSYEAGVDMTLNALADHLEAQLDLDAILKIAQAES
jgi:adenosylcobyric acid synthase